MTFADRPIREECWNRLGERTKERLVERAGGETIVWWAEENSAGRTGATCFGAKGLVLALPTINTEHRPVYELRGYQLNSATLRNRHIDHRPPHQVSIDLAAADEQRLAPDIGLSQSAKGILGNLPPLGQELLVAPFSPAKPVLGCDWYWQGWASGDLTMFAIYLAGAHEVTVAIGDRKIPVRHSEATAHWSLTVYRAEVTQRFGQPWVRA
ncbi:hypothetical protein ACW9HJ_26910 [Nocardia gipuzkoensis]